MIELTDIQDLKEILQVINESSISKLELVNNVGSLIIEKEKIGCGEHVAKGSAVVEPTPIVVNKVIGEDNNTVDNQATETKTSSTKVVAPLVGVFYKAASPESIPFIEVGQSVEVGDTLCIIEAMKILNEIKSPVAGVVTGIHVENGDIVEFNTLLIEIT